MTLEAHRGCGPRFCSWSLVWRMGKCFLRNLRC